MKNKNTLSFGFDFPQNTHTHDLFLTIKKRLRILLKNSQSKATPQNLWKLLFIESSNNDPQLL